MSKRILILTLILLVFYTFIGVLTYCLIKVPEPTKKDTTTKAEMCFPFIDSHEEEIKEYYQFKDSLEALEEQEETRLDI